MEEIKNMAAADEEMEIVTIMLPLEDGTEQEYAIMDEFEFDGNQYMVVAEIDAEDNISEEYSIYRFTEDGEEDVIVDYIEDDEEYNRVEAAYIKFCEEEEAAGADNK